MTTHNGTLTRSLTEPTDRLIDDIDNNNYAFIHLTDSKGVMGSNSFIKTAYLNTAVRERAVALAKAGYYVYRVVDGVARFVHEEYIPSLWHLVKDGTYKKSDEGLIYSLEAPIAGGPARNLVVVFSSISSDIFGNGLSRYFNQNYKSLYKYLPHDTAILRIADIGGIVGSFYLNTQYAPNNAERIASLIESVRMDLGLDKDAVITYGASKGATGALFHALASGYKGVCVEPIVNDEYYETAYQDSHFTADGVFTDSKEAVFTKLLDRTNTSGAATSATLSTRIVVIYSDQSPQAAYIDKIIRSNPASALSLVNYRHPLIKDHPDVSPQSLNLVSMYMNMMCYGLPIEGGNLEFNCEGPCSST